jgi:protein-S-isoprenylcysteine O-methyltransferase Ste14
MSRYKAYIVLGLAGLLGWSSLIAFMIFLFAGSLNLVKLGLSESQILCLDTALSLLFFIQHSGMVRQSFRQWVTQFIPEEYGNVLYAIASGIVLFGMIVFWQKSSLIIINPQAILHWPFRVIYLLSIVGFVWGIKALGSFDPFGYKPILNRLRGKQSRQNPFVVRGPYRWVRHPLYLFMILMIWSCPDLTMDRLLFNVLWTAWIVIGSYLEERDLIAEFGEPYRKYQENVPMLIPRWFNRE